jgi:hypothetical protein
VAAGMCGGLAEWGCGRWLSPGHMCRVHNKRASRDHLLLLQLQQPGEDAAALLMAEQTARLSTGVHASTPWQPPPHNQTAMFAQVHGIRHRHTHNWSLTRAAS